MDDGDAASCEGVGDVANAGYYCEYENCFVDVTRPFGTTEGKDIGGSGSSIGLIVDREIGRGLVRCVLRTVV